MSIADKLSALGAETVAGTMYKNHKAVAKWMNGELTVYPEGEAMLEAAERAEKHAAAAAKAAADEKHAAKPKPTAKTPKKEAAESAPPPAPAEVAAAPAAVDDDLDVDEILNS